MKTCQLYSYNLEDFSFKTFEEGEVLENYNKTTLTKDRTHWLNYHSLTKKDEINDLFEAQGFHKLTLEDVYTENHRPKLEEFESYIFFSIQSALPIQENAVRLNQEQISFILGDGFLVSLQEKHSDHFVDVRERIEQDIGLIRHKGSDFLLFRLLDAIVDNYFEVLENNTQTIQDLERKVLRDTSEETLHMVERVKRNLTDLRRIVVPLKDIAMQLEKSNNDLISKENAHYFYDLKDNCMSALDEIDANKNMLEGLTNLYYAAQGQKMNEIMKLLTIVSTIFIPLTFIVGVYGMNFDYMPELKLKFGYFIVLGLMLIIAIALWFYFRSRGWIDKK